MFPSWPAKDPNEVLDYQIDWTSRLKDDTINSSIFTVVSGSVNITDQENSDKTSTVWINGGELRERCRILNRITTANGRTMDQTMILNIVEK